MNVRHVLTPVVLGATVVVALLAGESAASASGVKLSQQQAAGAFAGAGVGRISSGNCVSRGNARCTSYDQINSGTVNGVITLRRASGCPITISAGTEVGHAPGSRSHYQGYKVDISHNGCVDSYVKRFRSRPATFGLAQYVSPAGNVYTDEGNHWDILFL